MSMITVVMPAYNAARYISQALDSIYLSNEQSFNILICNDGSTDNTCQIVEQYQQKHPNIKLIHNDTNRGTGYTRAKMMRLVSTDFVAFCDADDMVHPDRFGKQIEYFNAHPDISVLGSLIRIFYGDELNHNEPIIDSPEYDADIKASFLYFTTLFANTIMMRMKDIRKTGVEFDATRRISEDYDYWVSLAPFVKFANIQEVLVFYRRHETQLSHSGGNLSDQISCHIEACQKMLAHYGVGLEKNAARALCYPQYTDPQRIAWRTKKELTSFMATIIHKNFAIKVSFWQQQIILTRLFPYMQPFSGFATCMRVYRFITSVDPTTQNIVEFWVRAMLMPLFVSRPIRWLWWFITYRIRFKEI